MRKTFQFWSSSRTFWSRATSFKITATALAITSLLSLYCNQSWADEFCGATEAQYVDELLAGMEQFALQVTRGGSFSIKVDYPGNETAVLVISFKDRGKTLFVHQAHAFPLVDTEIRPDKTKGGYPGFVVALTQGHLGECEYSVVVHGAKFVVAKSGFKEYKQEP